MFESAPAYGFWMLAMLNAAIFILFTFSFFKPRTARDWRSFGAFSAFLAVFFMEMYGFPLTIYLLSGWLQSRFPGIDWFSHEAGHLLETLFGWKTNPHFGPFHLLSLALIAGGFVLIAAARKALDDAQRQRSLATTGAYAHVRHPQYLGFILVLSGFLLQWPTLLTLAMSSMLVIMYVRLARGEEHEALAEFGDAYRPVHGRSAGIHPKIFESCRPRIARRQVARGVSHGDELRAKIAELEAMEDAVAPRRALPWRRPPRLPDYRGSRRGHSGRACAKGRTAGAAVRQSGRSRQASAPRQRRRAAEPLNVLSFPSTVRRIAGRQRRKLTLRTQPESVALSGH